MNLIWNELPPGRDTLIAATLRLTREDFDALDAETIGTIAKAFGMSGRVMSRVDRDRIWGVIVRRRMLAWNRSETAE